MVELTTEELKQHFSDDIFKRISETADELGLECYVVGGYVRDIFLQRPSKDIDVVVVGSGIEMALFEPKPFRGIGRSFWWHRGFKRKDYPYAA